MPIIRLLLSTAIVVSLAAQPSLPGTQPLTLQGDLAAQMVDGINSWLIRETGAASERRSELLETGVQLACGLRAIHRAQPGPPSPHRWSDRSARRDSAHDARVHPIV